MLSAVEAMDLVDEEQRALPLHHPGARGIERLLEIGDAEKIAESCWNSSFVSPASSRATVVLPVPGGPQKISEPSDPASISRVSTPSLPVRCSCPGDLGERCRPQPVGERPRAALVEPRHGEEVGQAVAPS